MNNNKLISIFTEFINSLSDKKDKYPVKLSEDRWEEVFFKGGWQSWQTTYLDKITVAPDEYYTTDTYFGYVLDIGINPIMNHYSLVEKYFHIYKDESEEELEKHVYDLYCEDYDSGYPIEKTRGYLNEIEATDFKDFIIKIRPIIEKRPNSIDLYNKLITIVKEEE